MTTAGNLSPASRSPQEIIESVGAIYIGVQESLEGTIHCFNDPVTQTTLALDEPDLSELGVMLSMLASRQAFARAKAA
jgi:hypothetical protein